MTIVCPKCMHKSDDDDQVCEKCGALLHSTQRRDAAGLPVDPDWADLAGAGSLSGAGTTAGRASSSPNAKTGRVVIGTERIASNGDSADAIREALAYVEAGSDKSKAQTRYIPKGSKPRRRIDQKLLATIVITVIAVIAVVLIFVLTGSSPSKAGTKGGGTTPATSPTLLFQFSGTGQDTTGSFVTSGPFTFSYRLSCQPALTTPSVFVLEKNKTKVDEVASNVGSTLERGTHTQFGTAGTYTISVDTPSSCSWTVSGLT
jgi:hypothetical protein